MNTEKKRRYHKLFSSLENYFASRGDYAKAIKYSKMATEISRGN